LVAPPPPPVDAEAGREPSSIRFLVPVFLLVLITLAGCLYSNATVNDNVGKAQTPGQPTGNSGGWRDIRSADTEDEKDDPWYAGDEPNWTDVDLQASHDEPVSVAGKGWSWKSTFNAWGSARGRAEEDGKIAEVDEMGQRQTIKLVTNTKRRETYQPKPDHRCHPGEGRKRVGTSTARQAGDFHLSS